MKYLIILLSFFVDKSCTESKINQNAITIEYSASARNMYNKIVINNTMISRTDKRGGKSINKDCSKVLWDNLMETLKPIDVEHISNLESPSKKFLFDGAPIARLKITYQDNSYETQPFDHGNPNKDLKELIDYILTISKNIE